MNPLIILLIQELVLPEIMDIVRRRQAAGEPIDDASIKTELHKRALKVIATGEGWLTENPK